MRNGLRLRRPEFPEERLIAKPASFRPNGFAQPCDGLTLP
jgi:hypothetical protein